MLLGQIHANTMMCRCIQIYYNFSDSHCGYQTCIHKINLLSVCEIHALSNKFRQRNRKTNVDCWEIRHWIIDSIIV